MAEKVATFGQRLREGPDRQGITQTELARRSGISKSSISRYVKGDWEGKQEAVYALAQALEDGCEVTAISFRYGQRHTKELTSAQNVCDFYNVDHVVIDLDLSSFRSALTRKDIDVPMDREVARSRQDQRSSRVPRSSVRTTHSAVSPVRATPPT